MLNESELMTEFSGRRTLDDPLGAVSVGDFDVACEKWQAKLVDDLRPVAGAQTQGYHRRTVIFDEFIL